MIINNETFSTIIRAYYLLLIMKIIPTFFLEVFLFLSIIPLFYTLNDLATTVFPTQRFFSTKTTKKSTFKKQTVKSFPKVSLIRSHLYRPNLVAHLSNTDVNTLSQCSPIILSQIQLNFFLWKVKFNIVFKNITKVVAKAGNLPCLLRTCCRSSQWWYPYRVLVLRLKNTTGIS